MRRLSLGVVVAVLVACGGGGGTGTGGGGGSTGGGSAAGGGTATGGGTGTGGGSATGGGNATGGGTGGGSATGGGTGGGSATGGGGGTSGGGIATFARPGFFDQRLAAGPDGAMHLLFGDGAAERVNYGRCAANCELESSWSLVTLRSAAQQGTTTTGPYGLEVDGTGRVHALLAGVPPFGSSANAMVYATCGSNCTTASNWSFTDLSSLDIGQSPIGTTSTFTLSSTGRLGFLNQGQFNSYLASYVTCASNCTQLSSWTSGRVLNGNPLHAAVDGAGVTHVMLYQGTTPGGDSLLMYARCASDCTQAGSWQISPLGFLSTSGNWAHGFAVTPSGRVFMGYNQGTISGTQPNQQRLLINSCAGTGCLDLNTWSSFALGAVEEGEDGTSLQAIGDALLLTTTATFDLNLRTCDADCHLAASWGAPTVIDTADAIAQVLPPATGSSCPTSALSASWWPRTPRSGYSANGLVVVHNPYAIVSCPGSTSPSRMPNIGRLISTF